MKPLQLLSSIVSANAVPRISTFAFNYLQLGIIFYLLRSGTPPIIVAFYVLSFEAAILLDTMIKWGSLRFWSNTLLVVAAGFTILTKAAFNSPTAECACIFALALSLKKIRTLTQAMGTVKTKWRIIGYAFAGLFQPWHLLPLAICLTFLNFRSSASREDFQIFCPQIGRNSWQILLCVMFHHWHYFSYVYFVPQRILAISATPILDGTAFLVGWFGYYVFANARRNQTALVVIGHLVSSCAVAGMIFSSTASYYFLAWFITGLGAGTITLLRNIYVVTDLAIYEQLKIWESFGHILGVLTFGAAALLGLSAFSYWTGAIAGVFCSIVALLPSAIRTKAGMAQ